MLAHGGITVRLRPSLRAPTRLERLHDGFPALFWKIDTFDTLTIRAVILQAATDRAAAERLLGAMAVLPVQTLMQIADGPVASLCAALLPDDDDEGGQAKASTAKPMTWQAALAELYRIGTGWLCWTPAETWNATPTEILEALKGRIALLKAQNGIGDEDEPDRSEQRAANIAAGLDPEFDRAGLQALKAMTRA